MSDRPQIAPEFLEEYRVRAVSRQAAYADMEAEYLRQALEQVFDSSTPITIQVYQPVDTGRLVDVGPRPVNCGVDGLVFQQASEGTTGTLFQKPDASHRYTPSIELAPAGRGHFSDQQIELEGARHANRAGNWKNGIPAGVRIAQVPLTGTPDNLLRRKNAWRNEVLRLPHLGAAYTLSSKSEEKLRKDPYCDALLLHALCAGRIVHRVRFNLLVSGPPHRIYAPEVDRFEIAKSLCEGRTLLSADVCALVGTLILNHHYYFPFDPVAFRLISAFSSEQRAEETYYLHQCCPPVICRKHISEIREEPRYLFDTLVEDLDSIIMSYFRDPNGGHRTLDQRKEKATHKSKRLYQLRAAALTMLVQLAGDLSRGEGDEKPESAPLTFEVRGEDDFAWNWLAPSPACAKALDEELKEHRISHVASNFTKATAACDDFSDWVLSLLAPGHSKRPDGAFRGDKPRLLVQKDGGDWSLFKDSNSDHQHFLRAHTRAICKALHNKGISA